MWSRRFLWAGLWSGAAIAGSDARADVARHVGHQRPGPGLLRHRQFFAAGSRRHHRLSCVLVRPHFPGGLLLGAPGGLVDGVDVDCQQRARGHPVRRLGGRTPRPRRCSPTVCGDGNERHGDSLCRSRDAHGVLAPPPSAGMVRRGASGGDCSRASAAGIVGPSAPRLHSTRPFISPRSGFPPAGARRVAGKGQGTGVRWALTGRLPRLLVRFGLGFRHGIQIVDLQHHLSA